MNDNTHWSMRPTIHFLIGCTLALLLPAVHQAGAAAAEKLGFPAVVLRSDETTWVESLPLTLEGMDELIGRYVNGR